LRAGTDADATPVESDAEGMRRSTTGVRSILSRRCFTVGRARWHGPDSRVSR
jgi:hypothetical protein